MNSILPKSYMQLYRIQIPSKTIVFHFNILALNPYLSMHIFRIFKNNNCVKDKNLLNNLTSKIIE